MGIYIEGMEMPISCWDCFLRKDCDEIIIWSKRRPRKCPLVEVPTPHGRLIDADAMKTRIEGSDYHTIEVVKQWVDDQPTIIESEGE